MAAPERRDAIRTALIGLGRIAWQLEEDPLRQKPCTHAGSLARYHRPTRGKTPAFHLVACSDHHQDRIDAFREWWRASVPNALPPLPKSKQNEASKNKRRAFATNTDYRQLLANTRPEFVIIATRTDSHCAIAQEAIRNGATALLLEKPIGMNLNEARRIEKLARKHGTRVWVNFERRYHPAYRFVKQCIETQELGALRAIQGQVLTWPLRKGANTASANMAGPLLHDAIHWLDLVLWYTGAPQKIDARMIESAAVPGVEDTAYVNLDYPEFQVRLEAGGRRNYFEFAMQLDFEHGRIRSGNDGHFFYRSEPSKKYRHFRDLQAFKPRIPARNRSAWLNLYDAIRQELWNDDGPPGYERLEDAVAGMRIVQTCMRKLSNLTTK